MVYFWEDLKKTFIFDLICYSKLKNKLIDICTKRCTMKYLISCTGMGLIPMWRPMFYFHKTWWMILKNELKDLFVKKLFWSFLKKGFLFKNCTKKDERDLYSLIFERPHIVLKIN